MTQYDNWKCTDTEADLQAELDYKESILDLQLLEEFESLTEEELEDLKLQIQIEVEHNRSFDDFLDWQDEQFWQEREYE
jgi:hypothetical protein